MLFYVPRRKPSPRRDAGRPRGEPIAAAVLAETLEELATAGMEGLNIERIARRAEVNKTTIYRRWPTREALVAAALGDVKQQLVTGLPDTGSLRGDLIALLKPFADMLGQATGRALVRAAFAESADSNLAWLAMAQLADEEAGPLQALVARARARGEWARGADVSQLVFMLIGATIHRAMLEHAPTTERWLAALVDRALLGVLPRER